MTTLIIVLFVIFVLPPLLFAGWIGFVLFLIGFGRKGSLAAVAIILALGYGMEAAIIHWMGAPQAPRLTEDQAARILHSRPEFTSQGYAPTFRSVQGPQDSLRQSYGRFSFVNKKGERVDDAVATFYFRDGHWAFERYRWGPPDKAFRIDAGDSKPTKVAPPVPRKDIESPFAPGVAWKRLPDGSYTKYDPSKPEGERGDR